MTAYIYKNGTPTEKPISDGDKNRQHKKFDTGNIVTLALLGSLAIYGFLALISRCQVSNVAAFNQYSGAQSQEVVYINSKTPKLEAGVQ